MKAKAKPILAICIFISSCSFNLNGMPIPTNFVVERTTAETVPSREPEYEVLSPVSIRKGNAVIEVSFSVSGSTLQFNTTVSGLSSSEIPQLPPEESFIAVTEVNFFLGDLQSPLELNSLGGEGGLRPENDGTLTLEQQIDYQINNLLLTGETYHIISLVTFNEILGFHDPVRFDLEITP